MKTATAAEETGDPTDDHDGSLTERLHNLEGEVAELRHTMSDLAEIVVGDIKERRDAVIAVSAPDSEIPIPASFVPGGQLTLNAVQSLRRPWLLLDLLRELGAAFRMYMDPRYRVRRSTKLLVPMILVAFIVNYLFLNFALTVPVISEVFERLIDIILAVLLYKALSREVARYRQVLAQMAIGPRTAGIVPASLFHNDPDSAAVHRTESP
jgi:hypothetical protein